MNYFTLKIMRQKEWKKTGQLTFPSLFSPCLLISKPEGESVGKKCVSRSKIKTTELVLCRVSTVLVRKKKKKDIQVQVTKKASCNFGDST